MLTKTLKWIALSLLVAIGPLAAWAADPVAVGEIAAPVDLSNPGNVTARVSRMTGDTGKEAVDKFLQGAVSIKQGAAGPLVGIEWFGLSNDAAGADTVGLAPPLTTEFAPQSVTMPSGMELSVAGDAAVLSRAARTLLQNVETPAAEGEQQADGETTSGSSADSNVANAGAGAPVETEDAELPTIEAVTATETVETVVNNDAYGETTEGCTPELAEDEQSVIIMKAPTKNGVVDGECAESLDRPNVLTTYIGCGYDTATDENTAYAKRRRYYVYGGKATDLDTECVTDPEKSYQIVETDEGCRVEPDLESGIAKQWTKRVFVGRENEPQTVDSCAARNGAEFPIVLELCEYRDDFPAKKTIERKIASYVGPDGLKRNIGNCTDTEVFYVHNFDTSVCGQLADFTNNKLYEQYRVRVDLPTGPNYRTPSCKPFAEALTDLQETTAGCESFHADYAGYSLGGKRIVRLDNNQQIRECREADVRYEHVHVPEGWVYDDANLQAYPKDATYIDLPQPAGRTLVAAGVVRDGAAATAYTFITSYSENGGTEYVEGSCDKYVKQNKMEEWRRPDGSTFKRQNGFNAPLGPTNGCVLAVSTTWPRKEPATTTHRRVQDNQCGVYPHSDGEEPNPRPSFYAGAEYIGTKTLTRGDGVVFTSTATMGVSNCSKHCQQGAATINAGNQCPTSVTNPGTINGWRNTLGWW